MSTHHDALLIDDGRGNRHIMARDVSERGDVQLTPPGHGPSSLDTPPAILQLLPFYRADPLKKGTAALVELDLQEGLGSHGPGLHA